MMKKKSTTHILRIVYVLLMVLRQRDLLGMHSVDET